MARFLLRATVIVLPVLLIGCGVSGGNDDDSDGTSSNGASRGDDAASAPGAADVRAGAGEAAPEGTQVAQAGVLDRKVVFTSELEIGAEDVTTTFHRSGQIARAAGGYVEGSDLRTEDDDDVASVTLRVPATALDDVLRQLRGMPDTEVRREGSHSAEVTEEYTDLESRLRNLRAAETRYLDLLAQADAIDEILTVTDRLDGVRGQIEQIEGRLQVLDDMVELATVTVLITSLNSATPGNGGGPPSPAEALTDAWEWSLDALAVLAVAAAYVAVAGAWLAAPAAVVAFVYVRGRRRQVAQPGT